MAGILIAYTTSLGYTRRIAERVAAELRLAGHQANLIHIDQNPDPSDFDAVIVGAPVRNSAFLESVTGYAQRHAPALGRRPSGLYSACPPQEHRDYVTRCVLNCYLRDFQATTGWQPDVIASFAGGHPYPLIGARGPYDDGDLRRAATDWDAVAGFVEAFLHTLKRVRARCGINSTRPASA